MRPAGQASADELTCGARYTPRFDYTVGDHCLHRRFLRSPKCCWCKQTKATIEREFDEYLERTDPKVHAPKD